MLPSMQDRSDAPLGQSTLHFDTPVQNTLQGPVHSTLHVETLVQSTTLFAPTSTAQVEALSHE